MKGYLARGCSMKGLMGLQLAAVAEDLNLAHQC